MRARRSRWNRVLSTLANRTGATLAGCAVVGCAIVGNALWGQSARHPAPLFATRDIDSRGDEAPSDATSSISPVRQERSWSGGDIFVAAAQAGLAEAGFYSGPVDGVDGPETRAAILAFQRQHGLAETGRATPDLIEAIQSATSSPPEATESGGAVPVATVQKALSHAAYGPLTADGVLGSATRQAIQRFQADQGLPQTGEIDNRLVERLRAVGALGGT